MAADEDHSWNGQDTMPVRKTKDGLLKPLDELTMAAGEYHSNNEQETTLVCKTKDGLIKPLDELTMEADEDRSQNECCRGRNIGAEDRVTIIRRREHHLSENSLERRRERKR